MIWPYRSWIFKLYLVVSRLKKSVNFLCFCSKFSLFAIKFYRNQGKILYIKCTQGNILYSIQYGCKCVIDRCINYPFLLKEPEVFLYVLHCIYYVFFFFFKLLWVSFKFHHYFPLFLHVCHLSLFCFLVFVIFYIVLLRKSTHA